LRFSVGRRLGERLAPRRLRVREAERDAADAVRSAVDRRVQDGARAGQVADNDRNAVACPVALDLRWRVVAGPVAIDGLEREARGLDVAAGDAERPYGAQNGGEIRAHRAHRLVG